MKILIIIFFFIFLITGCSVEKRHYRSGYSVEWEAVSSKPGNLEKEKNEVISEMEEQKAKIIIAEAELIAGINTAPILAKCIYPIFIVPQPQDTVKKKKKSNKNNEEHYQGKPSERRIEENGSNTRVHPLALASFGSSTLGLLLGIIGPILAIIFGAIALHRIKKEPEKYKGKGLAIAGLTIGILALLSLIVLILYLIASLSIGI